MQTAKICQHLDRANMFRARAGYPAGYPVIKMIQQPGITKQKLWACKRRIRKHEEAAARLLAKGLGLD